MPSNLVEVDEFTTNVAVPNDNEPANVASIITGFQSLANRTRNLLSQIAALIASVAANDAKHSVCASYTLAGTALAQNAKAVPTLEHATSGFSITSNAVQVPAAGTYLVSATVGARHTKEDDEVIILLGLRIGTSSRGSIYMTRFSNDPFYPVYLSITRIVQIATPSSQRISIEAFPGGGESIDVLDVSGGGSTLSIVRIL